MTQSNINEINKLEHDDVFDVKKVSNFVSNGKGGLVREDSSFQDNSLTLLINIQEILKQLLLESKITNVHQHSMTDEVVNEHDVIKR